MKTSPPVFLKRKQIMKKEKKKDKKKQIKIKNAKKIKKGKE